MVSREPSIERRPAVIMRRVSGNRSPVLAQPAVTPAEPRWPRQPIAPGGSPPRDDTGETPWPSRQAGRWGWLPGLSLIGALGLVLVALADTGARHTADWAEPVFWVGLLVIYCPALIRLASAGAGRGERFGLVLALAGSLYLVKFLHSPLGLTHHDEFLHWRTAHEILETGVLFGENPLLPVSPLFPGLENVTVALASLSGLPIFLAGVLVIAGARLVIVGALFLFFEQISGSARVGGLGAALTMGSPTFVFFNAMFSYESLALAFVALTLAALALHQRAEADATRVGLTVAALLALSATVVTHHLTAYGLTALLALWFVVALIFRTGDRPRLGGLVLLALVLNVSWLIYVASTTVDYLAPLLGTAVAEIVRLITRDGGASRELFRSASGEVAPLWQRATGVASVGILLLALPVGLVQVWRRHRRQSAALALAALALAYPVTLALRLSGDVRGWEVAHRSSAFLFLALGFLTALAASGSAVRRSPGWSVGLVAVGGGILLLGGIITGWTPAWRLPGPYLPAAHTRSIEPLGLAAARWARDHLGPNNRIATDSTNYLLMGAYGEQYLVWTLNGGVDSSWVFFAPEVGPAEQDILRRGRIRYLIVDYRLSQGRLMLPAYPGDDPRGRQSGQPVPPEVLTKFDAMPATSRIFDSGAIVIYDLEVLNRGR